MSFPNAFANYSFAGLGFSELDVDTASTLGNVLLNQTQTVRQQLTNLSYDNTTGKISFGIAESPENILGVSFAGNAITDASGNTVVGFSGTWTGQRAVVIEGAAQPAKSAPSQETAAQISPGPANGLTVQGYWSAVIMTGGN
jgi:hypothetical protein